jgi:hypothetical protein
MSLWAELRVGTVYVGFLEIQRAEHLDLSDKAAIADTVNTYNVFKDNNLVGTVKHRYGDGAWKLFQLAVNILPDDDCYDGG